MSRLDDARLVSEEYASERGPEARRAATVDGLLVARRHSAVFVAETGG